MRSLRIPAAFATVISLVFLTAWLMGWPAERAVYLAPVIVVGFAAAAGLLILWTKVAWQQLRETRRPKLVTQFLTHVLAAAVVPFGSQPRSALASVTLPARSVAASRY